MSRRKALLATLFVVAHLAIGVIHANLIAFFLASGLFSLMAYLLAGLVDIELVRQALGLLPATFLGVVGGVLLARRVSENAFRTGALVLVLLSALALLV